jgi:Flp pilus assembly protein TadD
MSAVLALGLCSCQTNGTSDITGSLGEKSEASRAADPRQDLETYRDRYRVNPKDADAALQYAKALRATGQRSQAVAVLEQATIAHPDNRALLAGYGRALADNGNFQQAFDVFTRAIPPKIRIGGFFRHKALYSINSAGTTKPGSIMRAR